MKDLHAMQEEERLVRIWGRLCYNDNCYEAAREYWRRANALKKEIELFLIGSQQDNR
jgi:uncharacterized protein HemY